jgi:hypothetical protein
MKSKKWVAVYAAIVILVAIQSIPPDRINPPIDPNLSFESVAKSVPQMVSIVNRACRDCHSNATVWPWYSRIAPASWLVVSDVKEGREHLNFSEWGRLDKEKAKMKLLQICDEVREGGMPLWQYRIIHSQARLSQSDIDILCKASDIIREAK